MADPDLSPEDDLRVKRMLSTWGHAVARFAESVDPQGIPAQYLHTQLADGTIITWDEGKVSFSREGEGANITLEQIDAEIEESES